MKINTVKLACLATTACAGTLLIGCGGGSSSDGGGQTPTAQTLTVPFTAYATDSQGQPHTGSPLDCDSRLYGLGTENTEARVADFAFYLHDVRLVTDDGREVPVSLSETPWQEKGIALVDFQNRDSRCTGEPKPTNKEIHGEYLHEPGANYAGLRFTVGLPADINHALPRPAAGILARSDMQWGWAAGYKYLRMDVYPEGGVTRPANDEWQSNVWNIHLGATACNTEQDDDGNFIPGSTVCENPYLMHVDIEGFTVGDNQSSAVLIDYGAAVRDANLTRDMSGPAGCMSFDNAPFECGPVFQQLGLDYAGIENHQGLDQQALFKLAP